MYVAMTCDLIGSRQLHNRQEAQYHLISVLAKVNQKFKGMIQSPFAITRGDEWQGLLKYPSMYMEVIKYLEKELAPLGFYTGIGIGEISYEDPNLSVNQLDGPAFYLARDALNYAKEHQKPLVVVYESLENLQSFDETTAQDAGYKAHQCSY